MSLETDIQTAYEEQEAVETAARELEARIRRIDRAAWLMPERAYGKPIDRDAIAKSLTLRSLIAQKDCHLATKQAERMCLETQRFCEKNQSAALHRESSFVAGINPLTGRRLGQ